MAEKTKIRVIRVKHQKGNSQRPALIDTKTIKGTKYFVRTDTGEFFHDVVLTKKTLKWLAAKWEVPIAKLRNLRKVGREQMVRAQEGRRRRA